MRLRKEILSKFLLIFIFVFAFFLMIFSARLDSQTTDEGIHLFAGYTYLTKNDFRLDPEHPPLLKEISALPLLFFNNIKAPLDGLWGKAGNFYYDSWQQARILGENFFYSLGNNPEKLLFWGRLPFMILTILLGFFGYFWAKKLYGTKAGIFAAFLILFLPNILAHGRLINTDIGVTLFIFMAVYFWGEFLKEKNWTNLFLSGLFSGLAMASKYTAIILFIILLVLAVVKLFYENKNYGKVILGYLGILVISFIVVWASYGFSNKVPSTLPLSFLNEPFLGNFIITPEFSQWYENLRNLLFPQEFYKGIYLVFQHALSGHGSFLLGQTSNSGWWYYFPVLIFYKTPLPVFIFLFLSIVFWGKIRAKNLFDEILLIVPPVIFLGLSIFSKADLGVRHILPIFPFLLVFCAKSISILEFKKLIWLKIVLAITIAWYFLAALISYPNYLAYFNEFAGGPKGGYKIVADSNLDWGQDIYRLKKYLDENKIEKIYLVYPWDGDVALRYYGIDFELLYPEDQNVQGSVVISATYFQTDAYSWLKSYPFKQITPGLFIINLDSS